jgi:hypothetical protein
MGPVWFLVEYHASIKLFQEILEGAHLGPNRIYMSHLPLPCSAYNLKLLSFHADNNSYSVNYMEPGIKSIMERKISTFQILAFPGGPEAIASYNFSKSPISLDFPPGSCSSSTSSAPSPSSSSSDSSPGVSTRSKPWIYWADFNSDLNMYKVSMLEPDKTERTLRLMTTNEIKTLPGGTRALKRCDSFSWSYSSNSSITVVRALHFNPHQDDYTVTFIKPGETKQTEQIMKAAEVLTLRGGLEAIEKYKQLQQKHARVLSVFDFNSVLDNYKVNIMEPGAQKSIQKTMTAFDILNLQFGVTAIANYKRLHSTTAPVQATTLQPTLTPNLPPISTPSIEIHQLLSFEPPLKNLYIVQFNKDQDNYTVSFNEPRKRMKTEKMLTRLELLTMQGELPLSFPLCYS